MWEAGWGCMIARLAREESDPWESDGNCIKLGSANSVLKRVGRSCKRASGLEKDERSERCDQMGRDSPNLVSTGSCHVGT